MRSGGRVTSLSLFPQGGRSGFFPPPNRQFTRDLREPSRTRSEKRTFVRFSYGRGDGPKAGDTDQRTDSK